MYTKIKYNRVKVKYKKKEEHKKYLIYKWGGSF